MKEGERGRERERERETERREKTGVPSRLSVCAHRQRLCRCSPSIRTRRTIKTTCLSKLFIFILISGFLYAKGAARRGACASLEAAVAVEVDATYCEKDACVRAVAPGGGDCSTGEAVQ